MVVSPTLFNLPGCAIDEVRLTALAVVLVAHTTAAEAACPSCGQPSVRVHSHYRRTPRDLPLVTRSVRLLLHVRRFFCDQMACPRRTFAERLTDLLPVKAQRTVRFSAGVQALGFASSGEAAARVGRTLQLSTSPDTVLRSLRQAPLPNRPTPRVLGVDDFAFRKRHTYGTLLVDLEQHQPVDMLPDRAAPTLAAWLDAHPGVEVIARDRSTEYARSAKDGAPTALQVADRWHLLQNIREALERVLTQLRPRLLRLEPADGPDGQPRRKRLKPVSRSELERQQQRREERLARYQQVKQLAAAGLSHREIAHRVGVCRGTVIQYLRAEEFPELPPQRVRPSRLDQYRPVLERRWTEGCTNSSQLWRELVEQGYRGGRIQVARWAQQQRTTPAPTTPGPYRTSALEATGQQTGPGRALPPLRQLAWLLVKQTTALTNEERRLLEHLQANELFAEAYELGQRFVGLVRKRNAEGLDLWLQDAQQSGLPALRAFAETLAQDGEAVRAALSETWSTGQVEGQNTRLKCIKRQMYGRASFELLRCRVLYRA
jgi:transposase